MSVCLWEYEKKNQEKEKINQEVDANWSCLLLSIFIKKERENFIVIDQVYLNS